jgi:hypothetical protein
MISAPLDRPFSGESPYAQLGIAQILGGSAKLTLSDLLL